MKITDLEIMDTSGKTCISNLIMGYNTPKKKTTSNIYEPKVVMEDKVYLETYYRNVVVDETPTKIKAREL
jgi:hypothetical protein